MRWKNWRDRDGEQGDDDEEEQPDPEEGGGEVQRPKHESLEERNGLPKDGETGGVESVNISTRKTRREE